MYWLGLAIIIILCWSSDQWSHTFVVTGSESISLSGEQTPWTSEGHSIIIPSKKYNFKLSWPTVLVFPFDRSFWLLSQFIFAIVIPCVGWSKVMFLLLLIFRLNWEIPQLGKRLSSIDSPALRIQFWSICSRRWNSFHLETPTKYQKHTFVRKF